MSHSLLAEITCETLSEVSILEVSRIPFRVAKLSLAHQLSNQKLMLFPSPTFHRIPLRNWSRFFRIHFHTQECDGLGLTMKKFSLIEYLAIIWSAQRFCSLKSFQVNLLKRHYLLLLFFEGQGLLIFWDNKFYPKIASGAL